MTNKFSTSKNTLCIGILGSGQLGLMMARAAKKLDLKTIVYDSSADGPATLEADVSIVAPFDDKDALDRFAAAVDIITLEFENIPTGTLEHLAAQRPLYPAPGVVRICQDRLLEKEFLRSHGFPLAPFYVVTSAEELSQAMQRLNSPAILKTATLGYDGKGQIPLQPGDDYLTIWAMLKTNRAVLEKKIDFIGEASIICARSGSGEIACFPLQENIHRHGILDISIIPSRFGKDTEERAKTVGRAITQTLGVVGLLAVELFVLADGSLMVNELAPRPHNSGHHTLDSSTTSQFEQIIRAICGWPLGSPALEKPAVMVNLLGDLWAEGEPDWDFLQRDSNVSLHLYGKKIAKPGRKMGHFTITGNNRENLIKHARCLFEGLRLGDKSSSGLI
ncbi:MAG: 5-(carboxyamino)imidazole ribonucleotide synthase [Chthoniobacterales bacterium]